MAETCPHGVTLGQRCFACNSADTLPLTMPDQLARELSAAREKLATLERLEKLRAHPGFAQLLASIEDAENRSARSSMHGGVGGYSAEECAQRASVYGLLLEVLRGAP